MALDKQDPKLKRQRIVLSWEDLVVARLYLSSERRELL
jgi:hypothetical protein